MFASQAGTRLVILRRHKLVGHYNTRGLSMSCLPPRHGYDLAGAACAAVAGR